jgi:hypothetical protein
MIVYGLYSTRNNQVRYVGETYNVATRLASHLSGARSGKDTSVKSEWILEEESQGFDIKAIILANDALPHTDEQRFIDAFKLVIGERLLNTKHGHWASCRIKAGIAKAREEGRRPGGRPPLPAEQVHRVVAYLRAGISINKTAKALRVGIGTTHRIKTALDQGKYNEMDTSHYHVALAEITTPRGRPKK